MPRPKLANSTKHHDRFFKEVFSDRAVAQYLLRSDKLTRTDLSNFIDRAIAGRGEDIMPYIAETILEEGVQRGIGQGLQHPGG
ncbi:MAG: hypothetical protein HQK57_09285 [Deltaproteobacteria bacterium]|nr:hypothetical protein [Deltaproteobacteria bacterium]MBF0509102.1 hypothetical protein [Deltaproteobacteria bacterium]